MKKFLFLAIMIAVMCGCSTRSGRIINSTHSNSVTLVSRSYHYNQYEIEIISNPLGVIIEWDNGYIGKTPLKYIYDGTRNRGGPDISVVATPTEPNGQYKQKKYLKASVSIPRKIFFNTYVKPPKEPDKIDVEIEYPKKTPFEIFWGR